MDNKLIMEALKEMGLSEELAQAWIDDAYLGMYFNMTDFAENKIVDEGMPEEFIQYFDSDYFLTLRQHLYLEIKDSKQYSHVFDKHVLRILEN